MPASSQVTNIQDTRLTILEFVTCISKNIDGEYYSIIVIQCFYMLVLHSWFKQPVG